MMTQHDPDLCARVARVMGAVDDPNRAGHPEEYQIVWPDGRVQTCRHVGDSLHWWSPDTDPADAWQVLEWTQQKYDVHFDVNCDETDSVTLYDHTLCITHDEARGETRAIALCNAVAALGGEDD